MGKSKDLSGEHFGNLTVLEKAEGLQDRYKCLAGNQQCGRSVDKASERLANGRRSEFQLPTKGDSKCLNTEQKNKGNTLTKSGRMAWMILYHLILKRANRPVCENNAAL